MSGEGRHDIENNARHGILNALTEVWLYHTDYSN